MALEEDRMSTEAPGAKPPKDITPEAFFTTWLPERLAESKLSSPLVVRVRLDGAAWDLQATGTGLKVLPAGSDEADVTLVQSVEDWHAIVAGDLAPSNASPTDGLFLDAQTQQLVSGLKGTVRFEVTGYQGRTWNLTVKFGRQPLAAVPDATVSVDAETYAAILARTLPAPQAFFQGKIQLAGDAALAMQLGMAIMPKL
jgi:putative sterol carrier protein